MKKHSSPPPPLCNLSYEDLLKHLNLLYRILDLQKYQIQTAQEFQFPYFLLKHTPKNPTKVKKDEFIRSNWIATAQANGLHENHIEHLTYREINFGNHICHYPYILPKAIITPAIIENKFWEQEGLYIFSTLPDFSNSIGKPIFIALLS